MCVVSVYVILCSSQKINILLKNSQTKDDLASRIVFFIRI